QGLENFEADLWKLADDLRAHSNLASNEYFLPVMGLIFLRHASNRYCEAKAPSSRHRRRQDAQTAAAGCRFREAAGAEPAGECALRCDPPVAEGWQPRRGRECR